MLKLFHSAPSAGKALDLFVGKFSGHIENLAVSADFDKLNMKLNKVVKALKVVISLSYNAELKNTFQKKIKKNGNVSCTGNQKNKQQKTNPKNKHEIADKLWHFVDFYFSKCTKQRDLFTRVNRLANGLMKAEKIINRL